MAIAAATTTREKKEALESCQKRNKTLSLWETPSLKRTKRY